MSHSNKYQALAEQVRKHRVDSLATPFLARSQKEIAGKQIALPFVGAYQSLDIYHQFDPKAREITWFYYSESGEFLLQFSFGLTDHQYEVCAAHPALFSGSSDLKVYRQAIDDSLKGHYPPLHLKRSRNGEITIEPELI